MWGLVGEDKFDFSDKNNYTISLQKEKKNNCCFNIQPWHEKSTLTQGQGQRFWVKVKGKGQSFPKMGKKNKELVISNEN